MDLQVDQGERGPVVEEREDCGQASDPASAPAPPQHLYPQLEDAFEGGNNETGASMHSAAEEDFATAPCAELEDSDGGGEEVGPTEAPLPTAPPDDADDDVPNTTRSPPYSPEMPAVQMQPYTERQILGLYTNEQMEHNAQFVDMFLAEQVGCTLYESRNVQCCLGRQLVPKVL